MKKLLGEPVIAQVIRPLLSTLGMSEPIPVPSNTLFNNTSALPVPDFGHRTKPVPDFGHGNPTINEALSCLKIYQALTTTTL